MGKWEMVRLGDVLEYEQPTKYIVGSTDYNVRYETPVLTAGQSFVLGYTNETNNVFTDLPVIIFDDFTTAIKYVDFPFKVKSSAMKILKSTAKASIKYLYYYMCTIKIDTQLHKRYWISKYANIQIPLPPLEVQQQIADVLDRANTLIEKRKAQIAKLDLLIKSQFIEMFGDPVTNPKGWELELVGNCLFDIVAGWSVDGEQRERTTNEMAVLKVSAVTQGTFNSNEYKVIDRDTFMKKKITPQKGDLLFSRANTRELVGATCIIHEDYPFLILPDKLWKLKCQSTIHVYYLKYILSHKSVRNEMSANATGTSGSMYNISMQKLKNISIPLPPFHLQNTFAAFVECVEAQKALLQRSLEKLELNYKSLMQKCFRGEIF